MEPVLNLAIAPQRETGVAQTWLFAHPAYPAGLSDTVSIPFRHGACQIVS